MPKAHSTYPVILTSEDFEHWMLAADRRDAAPSVFFDEVSKDDGRVYSSTQDLRPLWRHSWSMVRGRPVATRAPLAGRSPARRLLFGGECIVFTQLEAYDMVGSCSHVQRRRRISQ